MIFKYIRNRNKKLARVKVVIKGTGTAKVKLSAESFNTDKKHIVPAIQQEIKLNKGVTETEMVLPMGMICCYGMNFIRPCTN